MLDFPSDSKMTQKTFRIQGGSLFILSPGDEKINNRAKRFMNKPFRMVQRGESVSVCLWCAVMDWYFIHGVYLLHAWCFQNRL